MRTAVKMTVSITAHIDSMVRDDTGYRFYGNRMSQPQGCTESHYEN